METLFLEEQPARHECIIAAAILSSRCAAKERFKALFGEKIGDERGLPMGISLGGFGDSTLISQIIVAAMISDPVEIEEFAAALHERLVDPNIYCTAEFRRGCILGLLSGLVALKNLRQAPSGIFEVPFFNLLLGFMWFKCEADGFVGSEAGLLSMKVAEFMSCSAARSKYFPEFLRRITAWEKRDNGFPSECAREVSNEFLCKAVTKLGGRGAAAIADALEARAA